MTSKNVQFGGSQLRLKKFNIKDMCEHATIAMIAKRASGKSYLTREILYHKRDIPTAVIVSKTEKLNKFYGEFIPDSYIFEDFDTSILSRIYQRQSKLNEDNILRRKEGKKEKDDRIMLVMDDCMSSKYRRNQKIDVIYVYVRMGTPNADRLRLGRVAVACDCCRSNAA